MAGPWFTVRHTDDDWTTLDSLWLSNGRVDDKARVDVRVRLDDPAEE